MPNLEETPRPIVLVVEDHPFIGEDLMACLEDAGCTVVGPIAHQQRALEALKNAKFDFATLDVELEDGLSFPVARELQRQDIDFVFVTGRPDLVGERGFKGSEVLAKPFQPRDVSRIVNEYVSAA